MSYHCSCSRTGWCLGAVVCIIDNGWTFLYTRFTRRASGPLIRNLGGTVDRLSSMRSEAPLTAEIAVINYLWTVTNETTVGLLRQTARRPISLSVSPISRIRIFTPNLYTCREMRKSDVVIVPEENMRFVGDWVTSVQIYGDVIYCTRSDRIWNSLLVFI